jgi:hypothetical protein
MANRGGALAVSGRTIERYSESEISKENTESVRTPNKTDAVLALDFSNVKITRATTNEDAIEMPVINGVNTLT